MQTDASIEDEPWYQNPWVWLIISIPSLTIVGCMFTIYLAITRPDQLVSDTAVTVSTPEKSSDYQSR